MSDISPQIKTAIDNAHSSATALQITGSGSKSFYIAKTGFDALHISEHKGIVSYEPSELILTARTGTRLTEIESALQERGQMLAFEPPHFGNDATLGGTIACNLSGPRRAFSGAARDFVLGCKIINGKGEIMQFGGQVMKNVAGYDVSRLMCGALGSLGVLLEVSLKVLPRPQAEQTLCLSMDEDNSIKKCAQLRQMPLPISASCYHDNQLYLRLSANQDSIDNAHKTIGGEFIKTDNDEFWQNIKEQKHTFFNGSQSLWRLSLPPATAALNVDGEILSEWGGALRWLKSDLDADKVRALVQGVGGYATLFRNASNAIDVFPPLDPVMLQLHKKLKQSFDPKNILNPGVMFS